MVNEENNSILLPSFRITIPCLDMPTEKNANHALLLVDFADNSPPSRLIQL